MKNIIILLSVCATTLVACTKSQDLSRSQSETTQIIVDFTNFPAHSVYTVTNLVSGNRYRFDSDSLKYFVQEIVEGDYQTRWQIINVVEDGRYKAKMLNYTQGTVTDWKSSIIQINGHKLGGTYTFTRENR